MSQNSSHTSEEKSTHSVRLQKFISDCGVTSRRKAELLITSGKVEVNGKIEKILGTKIDPDNDVVRVDGNTLSLLGARKIYLLFNKPRCVVTTTSDPEGRETVLDYCKYTKERIYPVGRLDYLSEGLLILTNDGDVANMIMHPRYNVIKTYEVKVFGAVTEALLERLKHGVKTDVGFLKPLSVRIVEQLPNKTWIEFKLSEGKNREIRKICEAVGMTVDKLRRVAIGNLSIEGLGSGKYIVLTKKELLKEIGINDQGVILKNAKTFISAKKSVDLKRKGPQPAVPADYFGFRKYRKETYFSTLEAIKQYKEEALNAQLANNPFERKL